ncbi:hypothetical protein ACFX2I_022428 [Malus domestica]
MARTNEQNVRHSQLVPRVLRQYSRAFLLEPPSGQDPVDHDDQTTDDDLSTLILDLTRILEQRRNLTEPSHRSDITSIPHNRPSSVLCFRTICPFLSAGGFDGSLFNTSFSSQTHNISRVTVVNDIVNSVTEVIGNSYHSALEFGFNDRKTDLKTRFFFMFSASRWVYGTPTFFVNGF